MTDTRLSRNEEDTVDITAACISLDSSTPVPARRGVDSTDQGPELTGGRTGKDNTSSPENKRENQNVVGSLGPEILQLLKGIQERTNAQTAILRRMDERQVAADNSRLSVTEVPAESTSAWNPLLSSALGLINPIVDRWKGSLDVLLVFIGLFSAIITSFFVDSVANLSPDETARTNELLVNMTEIMIQLSAGIVPSNLNFSRPEPFVATASDIRINLYWSLALVTSISTAALAVAGRGFLSTLTHASGKPHERLVDIYPRFERAQAILGPAVEVLPVFLTIPVILFVIGLLDTIFSHASQLSESSRAIRAAAWVSTIAIFVVGIVLLYALLHACTYPRTSPFRNAISQVARPVFEAVHKRLVDASEAYIDSKRSPWYDLAYPGRMLFRHRPFFGCLMFQLRYFPGRVTVFFRYFPGRVASQIVKTVKIIKAPETQLDPEPYDDDRLTLQDTIYHKVIQATHNDEMLDQAAAALSSVFMKKWKWSSDTQSLLSDLEIQTLLYLLSPEASYRPSRAAAQAIVALDHMECPVRNPPLCAVEVIPELIGALRSASQRESVRLNSHDLWTSVYTRAITALSHRNRRPGGPLTGSPHFLDLFTEDSYITYEPEGYPWVVSLAVFNAMSGTLEYRCQARSQTLATASQDVLDSVMHDMFDSPDPISPEVLITASVSLCRWEGCLNGDHGNFRSAIIRRLWRGQNPSQFQKLIQDLLDKGNARPYSYHLSYAYASTLIDITTLPEAQPRSLLDIIFAIRAVFKLDKAFHYRHLEITVPLQTIMEYFRSCTERPMSREQLTSSDFKELQDLYDTIYNWKAPSDWVDERARRNQEIKCQIVDTLRQACRNVVPGLQFLASDGTLIVPPNFSPERST